MRKYMVIFIFLTPLYVAAQEDSAVADSLLPEQINADISAVEAVPSGTRSLSISNPRISVIGDMQFWAMPEAPKPYAATLNEMEFAFQSSIDPYARAEVFFTVGHDPLTGLNDVGIEEAYLKTLTLPAHLQLVAGRIKPDFGRINTPHAHANAFVDYPHAWAELFGDGLSGDGASLSWMVPQTLFYQELMLNVFDTPMESPVFTEIPGFQMMANVHLKNFFDLNKNTTLEWGMSYMQGPADVLHTNYLTGTDLTLKWKPLGMNVYKSFTWQSEAIVADRWQPRGGRYRSLAAYSLIQWQLARRWMTTLRGDYFKPIVDGTDEVWGGAILAGWYATEFQKIEIEPAVLSNATGFDYSVKLRWIFVIGSHGAHRY